MNASAQSARRHDPNTTASPVRIVATPVIIGLRVYRYGPTATRLDVGSHGASVPLPTRTNRLMHHVTSTRPASNSRPPNVQAIQLQPSSGQRESLFANPVSIHR